jgi:hypothetical protein
MSLTYLKIAKPWHMLLVGGKGCLAACVAGGRISHASSFIKSCKRLTPHCKRLHWIISQPVQFNSAKAH